MNPDALVQCAQECLNRVVRRHFRTRLEVRVEIGVPKAQKVVPLNVSQPTDEPQPMRRMICSIEGDPIRRVVRLHPQLAVSRVPRYVLVNLLYYTVEPFIVGSHPDGYAPRDRDRANAWLERHEFPPI